MKILHTNQAEDKECQDYIKVNVHLCTKSSKEAGLEKPVPSTQF